MTRRVDDLFSGIASFAALEAAAQRAARGKRRKPGVAAFLARLEREVLRLERELLSGVWRPGRYVKIAVRDPKPRTVSAAPFRDRVVHHALCAAIEPLFERGFVFDSYANRRGKGNLHDVALAEVDDDVFSRFLLHDCTCAHPHFFIRTGRFAGRNNSRSKIGLFIEYLIGTGIAPPRPTPACEEPGRYLARFLVWLRRYRGIGERTIQSYHKAMRVLLPHLGDDPGRYSATLIRNTVRCRLETASRELVRRETSALRLYRKRTPSPPLRGQAASDRALSGLQFQGSNWSMRLLGCSGMRWSTSVSHACGSRPFILAVSMRV